MEFYGPVFGLEELRFEPILASAAYGQWRPINLKDTEEAKRGNRRIDLRIVMYQPLNSGALKRLSDAVGATIDGGSGN